MQKFEILCVTMNQEDFSKISEMNVHSDIVYANQAEKNSIAEMHFDGHTARMITTNTRGVGINRNIALQYAKGDICLFADDDVVYKDDLERIVLSEFEVHPDADVFIFHLSTDDPIRQQKAYKKSRKVTPWEQMPWGGFRIAVKLSSIRRANVWFSTLVGGGCIFPSGEDSLWLTEAKKKGLKFYVSDKTIGNVSFDRSSWFTGFDEKYYYGKGAYCKAAYGNTWKLRIIYYALRTAKMSKLCFKERVSWQIKGKWGYMNMVGYEEYSKSMIEELSKGQK